MRAHIVTGLLYGDEGKGRTVDYLAEKHSDSIVVRFSGGHQAGHNVVTDDTQHIFSSFGSGTLQGKETYISEHCVVYLPNLYREYLKLLEKGFNPKIVIHPMAKLATPFDVYENKQCEVAKEVGTCGKGIGNTMKRHTEAPFKINMIDTMNHDVLLDKMTAIAAEYYEYGDEFRNNMPDWVSTDIHFFKKCLDEVNIEIADYNYLNKFRDIIFEGSQGILLDMDHGVFPYMTYANTTPKNAMEICAQLYIQDCHFYAITRAYLTRHGSGPFDAEPINLTESFEFSELNKENEFQGVFKTGKMNYDLLNYAIALHKLYAHAWPVTLVVTCLDHIKTPFDYSKVQRVDRILYSTSQQGALLVKNN